MRYRVITRNSDFTRAYRRGAVLVHSQVVLYVCKNRCGYTRVGITASKKTGGAVTRNRARRVIRHALYRVLPQNVGGWDLVFVARASTAAQKSTALSAVIKKLFGRSEISAFQNKSRPVPVSAPPSGRQG